jgi:phosphohistidine phosphatase
MAGSHRHRGGVRIILIRHADAVSEGAGLPDEHRYLSSRGRRQAEALGALLADAGVPIAGIVTSPLARAIQTAEIAAAHLGWPGEIEVTGDLSPTGGHARGAPESLARRAEQLSPGALVAVGHEPSISGLARILGGARVAAFHKAEACYVEDGSIRWRRSPDG